MCRTVLAHRCASRHIGFRNRNRHNSVGGAFYAYGRFFRIYVQGFERRYTFDSEALGKGKYSFRRRLYGYLGNACQVDYALELKKRFVTDDAPLVVDPAMADNGKLYAGFDMAFVEKMRSLCSAADVVLPNITEAALLTGEEYRSDGLDEAYVEKLVDGLLNSGAQNVVLTGVSFDKALLGAAVYEKREGKIQYVFKQRQEGLWHGTGDLFASAFCGAYLKGKSMLDAAETACRFVVECIKNTVSCRQEHWYGVKFEKALAQLIEKNT